MRPHISAHAVANEVRMRRTLHKGAFLVVEGPSDKAAFRDLTDGHACQIVIAHDRENALAAMQILEGDGFPGVLAVIDADFSRLEKVPKPSGNILLTDLHDLECMMVASPAFGKLVSEFADAARVEAFERRMGRAFAETVKNTTVPLGYLRWISLRQRLDLRFEELAFKNFVERTDLQIDVNGLIKTLKDHSQRPDICNSSLQEEIAGLADPNHDPLQVCCGHDLLEMLSFALRHTIAGRNAHEVKREILERELRLAYHAIDFQQTSLARAIRGWQNANQPYRVLPIP